MLMRFDGHLNIRFINMKANSYMEAASLIVGIEDHRQHHLAWSFQCLSCLSIVGSKADRVVLLPGWFGPRRVGGHSPRVW